jgi:hypothetical protein
VWQVNMVNSIIHTSIESYIYYLPQTAPTVNMKGGGAYVLINPKQKTIGGKEDEAI